MKNLKFKRWARAVKREGQIMLPFIAGLLMFGVVIAFAVRVA